MIEVPEIVELLEAAEALVAEIADDYDRPVVSVVWNRLRLATIRARNQINEHA